MSEQHAAVTLIPATREHYAQIQKLCDERYGTGYVDYSTYLRWLECPELFLVAMRGDAFAGFSVMVPETTAVIAQHMAMTEDEVLAQSALPGLIYKSAALLPKFEHRGIMLALLKTELDRAKEMGYGAVYGSAWQHDGHVPMSKLFKLTGFAVLGERKMLWYGLEDYCCVVCKGRCKCDAVIYCKKL